LQEKLKMKHFQLKFASQFQSLSHSEKNKLVSISYDYDTCTIFYKAYIQAKVSMVKNTISSASNFKLACILPIRQEIISLTSYQLSNCKSDTDKIFILFQYAK